MGSMEGTLEVDHQESTGSQVVASSGGYLHTSDDNGFSITQKMPLDFAYSHLSSTQMFHIRERGTPLLLSTLTSLCSPDFQKAKAQIAYFTNELVG